MTIWVIVLEWDVAGAVPLGAGAESIQVVLDEFADCSPVALTGVDRYVVQLEVEAADPATALSTILARHADAADRARLGAWRLTRAELVTQDEFEREVEVFAEDIDRPGHAQPLGGLEADPIERASHALDRHVCPHEASDILGGWFESWAAGS